ncbi:MAG: NifB/NifX family molybdenum-iron cluster-binding protein [Ruminococcus flavefaciens]|nr:NifB/NifX family molybdenum-iron cluster-binding protein [Ruminococcus flavefaciens]
MSYKIAIATSDGENVNETFGSARYFEIYEVTDGVYFKSEQRVFQSETSDISCSPKGCGNSEGCGSGCGGNGETSAKVELVADCRAVVCKKIGFHIQKQLERKAISSFDVSCSVEEALSKISDYYSRIDRHETLRK